MGEIEDFLETEKRNREPLESPLMNAIEDGGEGLKMEADTEVEAFNETADLLGKIEGERISRIMEDAASDTPENAIRTLKLSRASGLPEQFVSIDPDGVERALKTQEALDVLDHSPVLKGAAGDLAPYAHPEDYENLSVFEQMHRDASVGLDHGMLTREMGLARRKLMGEFFRDELTELEKVELRNRIKEIQGQLQEQSKGSGGFIEAAFNAIGTFVEGVPQVLAAGATAAGAAGVGAAATGPLAPGVMATAGAIGAGLEVFRQSSAIEGGLSTQEMIDLGIEKDTANKVGETVGVFAGALEVVGANIIAKPFKDVIKKRFLSDVKRKILKETAKRSAIAQGAKTFGATVAGETATEVGQELTQIAGVEVGKALSDKEFQSITLPEIQHQVGEIFKETLKAMTILAIPGAGVSIIQQANDAKKAQATQDHLRKVGENVQASRLKQSDSETHAQFVERVAEASGMQEVFIDARKLQEVYQDDTELLAEEIGASDQLEDAIERDGDIVIPYSTYVDKIAGDINAHNQILNHTKFHEDGLTPFQAEEAAKGENIFKDKADQILREQAENSEFVSSSEQVFNAIRDQLRATQRFNDETTDNYAALHQAFAVVKANQLGITPAQVYEKFGLQIRGEEATEQELLNAEARAKEATRAERDRLNELDDAGASAAELDAQGARVAAAQKRQDEITQKIQDSILARRSGGRSTLEQMAEEWDVSPEVLKEELEDFGGDITQTLRFQQWFGSSEVVDEQGRPLVVYHGTQDHSGFTEFIPQGSFGGFNHFGNWFTSSPDAAAYYAKDLSDGGSGPIYPAYIAMRLPWKTTWEEMTAKFREIAGVGHLANVGPEEVKVIREWLKSKGHDGVIIEGFQEREGHIVQDLYVPLDSNQIKSKFNRGTFTDSPNIMLQSEKVKRTPEFREFFKDSEVVDESGEPLVVYHGTDQDFAEFDTSAENQFGAHFGSAKIANTFAENTGRVLPVFLNIKNAVETFDLGDFTDMDMLREGLGEATDGPFTEAEFDKFKTPSDVRAGLEAKGYDGVVYTNTLDLGGDISLDEATSYIAFHPEQIKSIFNERPTERMGILNQSAAPLQKKPMKIKGSGPGGRVLNWDLAEALTERHMKKYGRKLDPANEEDFKLIVKELNKEYKEQLKQEDSGNGWYVADIDEAIEVTKSIIPELSEPVNRDLFLTITALLSPQQKPVANWENAILAMQGYLKDGKIPLTKPNGKNYGVLAQKSSLQLLQHMIDSMGVEESLSWLRTPHTGKEMAELRKESGIYSEKKNLGGYLPDETNLTNHYLGIYMMGPKVGDFMQNSVGLDQNAVTVDLWLARTYNRMIGRLLDVPPKAKENREIASQVRGIGERNHIKRIVRELAKRNKVAPSSMQASLWYFEQRLYANHGISTESQNFAGAARTAAEKRQIVVEGTGRTPEQPGATEDVSTQELFQEGVTTAPTPRWYHSALNEAVHAIPEKKRQAKSAKEWLNIISKLPKVKKEEIAFTGLDNYLNINQKKYKLAEAQRAVDISRKALQDRIDGGLVEELLKLPREVLEANETRLANLKASKEIKLEYSEIVSFLDNHGMRLADVVNGVDSTLMWYDADEIQIRERDERADRIYDVLLEHEVFSRAEDIASERLDAEIAKRIKEQFDAGIFDSQEEAEQAFREGGFEDDIFIELREEAEDEALASIDDATRADLLAIAIEKASDEMRGSLKKQTKFQKWSHAGGENYFEWLVTLPDNPRGREVPQEAKDIRVKISKWADEKSRASMSGELIPTAFKAWLDDFSIRVRENQNIVTSFFTKEELAYYKNNLAYFRTVNGEFVDDLPKNFVNESHFSNPNILVHIRGDERRSDADKAGRVGDKVLYLQEIQSDWADALRNRQFVPQGPFVNDTQDWTALALKRMIHHALEGGFDRIEWSSGLQQSNRYDMSRFVDGVVWNSNTKELLAREKGSGMFESMAQNVEAADLPKYLGGDVAARLLEKQIDEEKIESLKVAKRQAREKADELAATESQLFELVMGEPLGRGSTNELDRIVTSFDDRVSESRRRRDLLDNVRYMNLLVDQRRREGTLSQNDEEALEELLGRAVPFFGEDADIIQLADESHDLEQTLSRVRQDFEFLEGNLRALERKYGGSSNEISVGDLVLTDIDLEASDVGMQEYYDKILPMVAKKVLKQLGAKNTKIDPAGDLSPDEYSPGRQPGFDLAELRQKLTDEAGKTSTISLMQEKRGSFQFGEDITEDDSVINLFKGADLSTFLHESGHFFFEATRHLANQPDSPQVIKDDMQTLLRFAGGEKMSLETWNSLSLEERRAGHEKVARAFEAYLFEGKAPSVDMANLFRRFRSWLVALYKNLMQLNVTLTDDVRGVFDRMLATEEQIRITKEADSFRPIYESQEEAGMSQSEWADYQKKVQEEKEEADELLQTKVLRDMRYLHGARGRVLAQLQREQRERRNGVRKEATVEVAKQRVFKAKQFLRTPVAKKPKVESDPNVVDPARDSLFAAIAKLGGLDRAEAVRMWGLDISDRFNSGLGASKPVLRKSGGKDLDAMAEALAEMGYLELDENGKWDLVDFEERFNDEHLGNKRYSVKNDEWDVSEAYENFLAEEEGNFVPINLDQVQGGKMSLQGLIDIYGNDEDALWRQLPLKGRYSMVTDQEHGWAPEIVAQTFGYSSADEMIKELIATPDMRTAVNEETDRRMLELYGDMNSEEAKTRAIAEALHGENRARVMHTEMAVLAKKVGGGTILASTAREIAKDKISRMQVGKIKPNQYIAAERRANQNAEKALAKGNLDEAADHKRAAILNYYFAKEATNALSETDRALRYFDRLDKKAARERIGHEYADQIDRLLNRFDLRKSVTQREVEQQQILAKWIAAEEAKGNVPVIDDRLQDETRRQHYRLMPMEELRGLRDAVKNIEHLGANATRLLREAEQRDLDKVADEIGNTIEDNNRKGRTKNKEQTLSKRLPQDQIGKAKTGFYVEHRKMANLGREADGFNDTGPFWENVIRPMNARADWEAEQIEKATERLGKIFDVYKGTEFTGNVLPTIFFGEKQEGVNQKLSDAVLPDSRLYARKFIANVPNIENGANGISLSKMERIMIALNWGNNDNRNRVMDGYGWNEEHVDIVLGGLDARDWGFVQSVWDFIEEFWPQIEAKEKRVSGVAPEKVEALPVITKYGQFRGGYFPITFDEDLSQKAFGEQQAETASMMKKGAVTRATTRRGHTKARAEAAGKKPIRADFGVIFEHVNQVIHDLAWHEYLIDTNKILNHPSVELSIRQFMGSEKFGAISNTLEDVAAGDVEGVKFHEKAFNYLRAGVSISAMGWNLGTALLQPFGITQSMVRVGVPWVAKAMLKFYSGASAMDGSIKQMYEESSFMRLRAKTMNREINEIRNKIGRTGLFSKAEKKLLARFGVESMAETYFALIAKAQLLADAPTWLGMKEKALAAGEDLDTAVALADQAVIDSQSSGHIKDLAGVQRGNPIKKLFTNFMSYFQTTFNLTMDSLGRTNFRDPLAVGLLGVDLFLLYTAPIVLSWYVRDALLRGECDHGADTACVLGTLGREHVSYLISGVMGVRELNSAVQGFYGYQGPAGTRFFSDVTSLSAQIQQGEFDEALVKSAGRTFGVLFHLPAIQMERTLTGYMDLQSGKTNIPTAPLFGVAKQ